MSIKGSVDQLTTKGAQGWIYSTNANAPVVVEAVLHHRVIGEALADAYRNDLAEVGFGDGRCGFTIDFSMPIEPAYLPLVTVRPSGGDVELPHYSNSGFTDLLASLYTALPLTGRQLSVFGGLWTDRTDALALLKGRHDLHRFSDEVALVLERLIVHGHVTLDLPRNDPPWIDGHDVSDLERTLGSVFFRPNVQDALVAAFDDAPVVMEGSVLYESQREFRQPPTGRALSSPVESMALLASKGPAPTAVEIVRGSHRFPDFAADGQARWLLPAGAAALSHAASIGAPIDFVTLNEHQILLVAAGAIHRTPQPSADGTIEALVIPRRRQPVRREGTLPYREVPGLPGRVALPSAA